MQVCQGVHSSLYAGIRTRVCLRVRSAVVWNCCVRMHCCKSTNTLEHSTLRAVCTCKGKTAAAAARIPYSNLTWGLQTRTTYINVRARSLLTLCLQGEDAAAAARIRTAVWSGCALVPGPGGASPLGL